MTEFTSIAPLFENVEEKMKELYDWKEHYFSETASEKVEIMQGVITDIESIIDEVTQNNKLADSNAGKALAAFMRGRAWNALDEHQATAEECLGRAVKLDPTNHCAWLEMGLCYWKKGDKSQAKRCLEESINLKPSKEALRELSQLTRQVRTREQKAEDLSMESIELAKRAIKLDFKDHLSWTMLGNAWTFRFFYISSNRADLEQSLKAYKQAMDLGGDVNPDLLHNRGECTRYVQDYDTALGSYRKAVAIDPSQKASQTAADDIEALIQKTAKVQAACAAHLKGVPPPEGSIIKRKRYDQLLASLRVEYTASESGKSHTQRMIQSTGKKLVKVCDIAEGKNVDTLLALKIVVGVSRGSAPPECFACTDVEGRVCLLSVYNAGPAAAQFSSDSVITVADAHVMVPSKQQEDGNGREPAKTMTPSSGAQEDADSSFEITPRKGGGKVAAGMSTGDDGADQGSSFAELGLPVVQVYDLASLAFNGRPFSEAGYSRPNVSFQSK